jgi:hypothetical protein
MNVSKSLKALAIALLCAFTLGAHADLIIIRQLTPIQRIVQRDGKEVWQRYIEIDGEWQWVDDQVII